MLSLLLCYRIADDRVLLPQSRVDLDVRRLGLTVGYCYHLTLQVRVLIGSRFATTLHAGLAAMVVKEPSVLGGQRFV